MFLLMRSMLLMGLMMGTGVAVETEAGKALLVMVKERDQAIQTIVRSKTKGETPQERAKLKAIVGDLFDFNALSELSLGRDWAERTEAERKAFVDINRQLIEKNYADPKLYTKAEKIDYIGVEVKDKEATVKTMVYYKTEKSAIDYKMHQVNGKWLIYDMVIDELSIGQSNRSQFRKEIRNASFESLMDKLRKKLAETAVDEKGGA